MPIKAYTCHHCGKEQWRNEPPPPSTPNDLYTSLPCGYCFQPLQLQQAPKPGPQVFVCVSCLKPFVRDSRADPAYQRVREAVMVTDGQANMPVCDGCRGNIVESKPPVSQVFESPNFLLRLAEKQKYQG